MIIRESNQKHKFSDINRIVYDGTSKKILSSNHPLFKPGQLVNESTFSAVNKNWVLVKNNPFKRITEEIAVSDLISNCILPDEKSGKWSIFSRDETDFFVQTQNGQVAVEDVSGELKFYDTLEAFLKSLPDGFYLAGQISDEDLDDEQEGDNEE